MMRFKCILGSHTWKVISQAQVAFKCNDCEKVGPSSLRCGGCREEYPYSHMYNCPHHPDKK